MNIAYLAGYTDGDGCISCRIYIQKPKMIKVYESSIQICSVNEDICNFFKCEFYGAVHKRPEKRTDRKDSWVWYVKGNNCLNILVQIEPFLILKRKTSLLLRSLINQINSFHSSRGKSISEESHFIRESIVNQIKQEIHMNDIVDEDKFNTLKVIKKSIVPSRNDLAYLAGLIDSEGCFRIKSWQPKREGRNRSYVISLEIGNTKFSIFPWLMERFGGNVVFKKSTNQRHRPVILWSLSSDALFQFLNDISPYLRIKKERCEKLSQFHQTGFTVGGERKSDEYKKRITEVLTTREKLFEEFQVLNKKGKH